MLKILCILLISEATGALIAPHAALAEETHDTERTPQDISIGDGETILVCSLLGQDISQTGLQYLTDLVRTEVAKTAYTISRQELFYDGDIEALNKAARHVKIDQVLVGRIAMIADLFMVELQIIDCNDSSILSTATVEVLNPAPDARFLVRTATQRLLGIGGHDAIRQSYLKISSTPTGSKVFVDDLYEGRTHLRVPVDPGQHILKAKLSGYADWLMTVNVKPGETLSINANLVKSKSVALGNADGRNLLKVFSVPYATGLGWAGLHLSGVTEGRPYVGMALVMPPVSYFYVADALKHRNVSIGQASMVVSSGLWGAAWGLLGAAVGSFDNSKLSVGTSVAASTAGIALSSRYAASRELSRKRVSLINVGGFLGSAVGLGIPYLFNSDSESAYYFGLIAGGLLGTGWALDLTHGLDFVDKREDVSGMLIMPTLLLDAERSMCRPCEHRELRMGVHAHWTF